MFEKQRYLPNYTGLIVAISFLLAIAVPIFPEFFDDSFTKKPIHNQDELYDLIIARLIHVRATAPRWTAAEILNFVLCTGILTVLISVFIIVIYYLAIIVTPIVVSSYIVSQLYQYLGLKSTICIGVLACIVSYVVYYHDPYQVSIAMYPFEIGPITFSNILISIPENNESIFQYIYNNLEFKFFQFKAILKHTGSHYDFPPIDFTMPASRILVLIGPKLHKSPFNSQILTSELYLVAKDKSIYLVQLFRCGDVHFSSRKHFKTWFLNQYSHGIDTPNAPSTRSSYLAKELQKNLRLVQGASHPKNLQQLQAQIFLFSTLPYLLFYSGDSLFHILKPILWCSHREFHDQVDEIIRKHPSIDFHNLMYILSNTHLKVPQSSPLRKRKHRRLENPGISKDSSD